MAAGVEGSEPRWDVGEVSARLAAEVPAFAGIDLASVGDAGLELC